MTHSDRSSPEADVSVHLVDNVRKRLDDLVMAWAKDARDGKVRYILELSKSERGKQCGCVCISCGEHVLAVNAAKEKWRKRPHFRHAEGPEHPSCIVLSARAALLSSLRQGDWIVLPRQRRSVAVTGLSGEIYEAWIEAEAQEVNICNVEFQDQLTAMVELEDGRRLKVLVTGTTQATPDGTGGVVPSIIIAVDSPELARMSPAELRSRLIPLIGNGTWCGHWPDPELEAQKLEEAKAMADAALDLDDQLQDLPADLRRESLLHREVKAILESASSLMLPGWGQVVDDQDRYNQHAVLPRRVVVRGAVLEHRLGRIIPDVIARLADDSELLIEVTVTNRITDERLERIRQVNLPTIEIDFSRMGGIVSRERLRQLVLDEVLGKAWLHRPDWARRRDELWNKADLDVEPSDKAFDLQSGILGITPPDWGRRYLTAVQHYLTLNIEVKPTDDTNHREQIRRVLAEIEVTADALHLHGYPEAVDSRLYSLLGRLLSVKLNTAVGYRYDTAWQVINTMMTDTSDEAKSWHSLYLLAIKIFQPSMNPYQRGRFEGWRNKVVESIRQEETTYQRDSRYDKFLALLFPEMAEGLANPFGKRSVDPSVEPIPAPLETVDLPHKMFSEGMGDRWVWATRAVERVRRAELAASRMRLNGHDIGHDNILYHLARSRQASPPWMYVSAVCEGYSLDYSEVMSYLYQHGYIRPTSER